jgi:hypothetical protein
VAEANHLELPDSLNSTTPFIHSPLILCAPKILLKPYIFSAVLHHSAVVYSFITVVADNLCSEKFKIFVLALFFQIGPLRYDKLCMKTSSNTACSISDYMLQAAT